MDRLEAMTTLLAVVEGGSLSAASRKLGMPLATVSRKISELEAYLRARLLIRTTRSLSLTDAGRAYVEACRRILQNIEEAERAAAGEYAAPRGDLTVAAPIVFGRLHVLPVITAFIAAYPDIDVRLALSDRVAHMQEDAIDVAVRIGELPDSSLIASRVGEIGRVVCASRAYLKARGTPRKPADLARHDCISFEGMTSPRVWKFVADRKPVEIRVRSRLIVNTAEAAVDAAVASVGMTRVLSYQAEAAVRSGKLVPLLRDFEPPAAPVSLVHAGRGMLPAKLRAFLDFSAPRLKARLEKIKI